MDEETETWKSWAVTPNSYWNKTGTLMSYCLFSPHQGELVSPLNGILKIQLRFGKQPGTSQKMKYFKEMPISCFSFVKHVMIANLSEMFSWAEQNKTEMCDLQKENANRSWSHTIIHLIYAVWAKKYALLSSEGLGCFVLVCIVFISSYNEILINFNQYYI